MHYQWVKLVMFDIYWSTVCNNKLQKTEDRVLFICHQNSNTL